jgi:hypothetical protein
LECKHTLDALVSHEQAVVLGGPGLGVLIHSDGTIAFARSWQEGEVLTSGAFDLSLSPTEQDLVFFPERGAVNMKYIVLSIHPDGFRVFAAGIGHPNRTTHCVCLHGNEERVDHGVVVDWVLEKVRVLSEAGKRMQKAWLPELFMMVEKSSMSC